MWAHQNLQIKQKLSKENRNLITNLHGMKDSENVTKTMGKLLLHKIIHHTFR